MAQRTIFFFVGIFISSKTGNGMMRMNRSEEMLRTALVIRWFVAAEH